MSSYLKRKHLLRRYVKLVLEELESRHVPSLLGLQIELPLSGILPSLTLSTGPGATSPPAATTTPSTTTSPSVVSVSWSFTPSGQSTNATSVSIVFTGVSPAQQSTPIPSASGTDASSAGASSANSSSASSASAFHEGGTQGSGSAFSFPSIAFPALAIQAAQAGSSSVLGGTVTGINFELLGNLPSLLGPSNFLQGTSNTSQSATQLLGPPYGGSVYGRLDLGTDRTTGATTAFGLEQPAPEQREEPLPENPPTPPDDQWWISAPPASEGAVPHSDVPLLEELNLLPLDMRLPPNRPIPVDQQSLEALRNATREDFLFVEDDLGLPSDEEQPEEQSGIPAAVAILSCAVGAYWAPRFRSSRRNAAALPANEQDA